MLIADLKQPCPVCKGSGHIAGFNEYGSLKPNVTGKCLRCGGNGYILTELGQDMWKLLRPMVRDLIRQELQNVSQIPKTVSKPKDQSADGD